MKFKKLYISLVLMGSLLAACKNDEVSYPDFPYQTVYFANQFPVRTIVLGEDLVVDNSLDNLNRVSINATTGGVYENKKNVSIDVKVDESLLTNLHFSGGSKIAAMPSQFYELMSNQITIPAGSSMGGVQVQLTNAFFADPLSLMRNYVIPLVMTKVSGADTILKGTPLVSGANPSRLNHDAWSVRPKDYVLYAVKFVNPWHGNYLRRGVDQVTPTTGAVSTSRRRKAFEEENEVVSITTTSLKTVTLPLVTKNTAGTNVPYTLVLTFDNNGACTVTGNNASFDITGTGKFVSKGEKNSIGGKDRSALYLDYSVNFKAQNMKYDTKDTLVVRDRNIKPEYFDVVIK